MPILDRRAEIEAAIARHQVVIVCGQTGSGKTTQLPQMCFEMGLGKKGLIGHTQPRRLAARAVAARIAEERGVRLGGLVGVKVRFQDQTSRETVIKVMTDGTLLAEMTGDPELRAYSTIIIDEAHERSLNVDFLIGYLRRLLPKRPDLKVIITSATIDPGKFSATFGGQAKAPLIEVSGRMYPVEVRYREAGSGRGEDENEVDAQGVADAVVEVLRIRTEEPKRLLGGTPEGTGDVLVFLPGEREIRAVDVILRRDGIDAEVLPLFSRLTNQEQDRIFHPGARRHVILATNVAETSLTVPGIRYVVDTGLVRMSRYEPHRKVQTLPIEPISRASAEQRAGRCGRVSAGVCVRLYSEKSFRARPEFTEPEITRSNLAAVVLQMKTLGLGAVEEFPYLDPPDPRGVKDAYETLFELGAIEEAGPEGAITDIGRAISRLPVDPRIGRMLLAAEKEGSLAEVLVLAAALSIQDPRERPMARAEAADQAQAVFRNEGSDFLTLLKLWDQYTHAADRLGSGQLAGWCREHFLSVARMREWGETLFQLRRIAEEMDLNVNQRAASDDAVHRALLTGLISNVACREAEGGSFDYRSVRGGTVQIFPGSVLFKKGPKWMMAAEMVQTTRLYARTVARVDPKWIEELSGHMFRRQVTDPHLDAETGDPSAWERISIGSIVVVPRRRTGLAALDPKQAREVFIREGLVQGKWKPGADHLFAGVVEHNRRVLEGAERAEAKLRRRGVRVDDETLAAWFEERVPRGACDPATLRESAKSDRAGVDGLRLAEADVIRPEAGTALDGSLYPDVMTIEVDGREMECPIEYAFAAGKDEDGVTVAVGLGGLGALSAERLEWLVPGMLGELIAALIKGLPKPERTALEKHGTAAELGAAIAGVVTFGEGSLAGAVSEAARVLHEATIDRGAWSFRGIPGHMRMRVRVVDDHGKDLGADRDLPALLERLGGRIKRSQAAKAKAEFERGGITEWNFGELPDVGAAAVGGGFPVLADRGDSVAFTLCGSAREAGARTVLGVRRLFALACRDELEHHLATLSQWSEMAKQYGAFGSAEGLRRDLAAVIAERTFMMAQAPVRTREQFEERLGAARGKLAVTTREVAEAIGRTLEARARVAHRIAGGTPRLWAASIADIREHATYLMPRGFVGLLSWERLRNYPRWAEAMRARLFSLREEGSRAETEALALLGPRWKKFTGWVAAGMSAERAGGMGGAGGGAMEEAPHSSRGAGGKKKAALPQARRTDPTVNVDAGEWAMAPGRLTPEVEKYRWALEDLRVALFEGGAKSAGAAAGVDALWRTVEAT